MKILILDTNHPILIQSLKKKEWEIDEDYTSNYEEVLDKIEAYDGIVIRSRIPIDKTFLEKAKNLKFIGRVGAGLENIDTQTAKQKGIEIINAPQGNRDALAEHAIGMLLSLMNKLREVDIEVRNGIWKREENRGVEIMGKTVGFLGYGYMGKATAQRLSGFGVKTIFYDLKSGLEDENASEVSMEEFFEQTDIFSLHIPISEENKNLVDYNYISKFKKPIIIINTARGEVLPIKDLVKAMKEEKVIGACLDVLEYEKSSFENLFEGQNLPNEFKELLQSDKVIFSPHIAGWTHESKRKLAEVIVRKVEKLF